MFALALAFKFPLFILTLWTTKLSAVTINRASHTHSQVQSIVIVLTNFSARQHNFAVIISLPLRYFFNHALVWHTVTMWSDRGNDAVSTVMAATVLDFD